MLFSHVKNDMFMHESSPGISLVFIIVTSHAKTFLTASVRTAERAASKRINYDIMACCGHITTTNEEIKFEYFKDTKFHLFIPVNSFCLTVM